MTAGCFSSSHHDMRLMQHTQGSCDADVPVERFLLAPKLGRLCVRDRDFIEQIATIIWKIIIAPFLASVT